MPETSAIAMAATIPRPNAGQNDKPEVVDADRDAVHAEAEIERLAKRQQPDIAEQQIDAGGKQRPDQDFGDHADPEFADERRDRARAPHHERREQRPTACARCRRALSSARQPFEQALRSQQQDGAHQHQRGNARDGRIGDALDHAFQETPAARPRRQCRADCPGRR